MGILFKDKDTKCRTCQHPESKHQKPGFFTPGKQCEAGNCQCLFFQAR